MMTYNQKPSLMKRFFTEERMAAILRWWAVAAVYFFIGWGTGLGYQTSVIDFVFFLGIGVGVAEMFVIMPVIRNMFNTREGFYWRQKTVGQKVRARMSVFFRSWFIVILIVLTYDAVNMAAIQLLNLPADRVFLPGEPIMFGVFYLLYYTLLMGMYRRIKSVGNNVD